MQFFINDDRLNQLAGFINEMPTKYGFQIAYLLNVWRDEAVRTEQKIKEEAEDRQREIDEVPAVES